ncbi:hypothetical protein BDV38DRAFT_231619 [Aspergillus pseudotamarii]|uniref:Uncharacterized protein n=1 Tax=Aspergillus pseudotamarii TaxID=132259 RepID=A0A5N6TAY9_ASPPS|nr:uncharacterized protein BDV38DRAFT_231619 [Aspergillus pseudotamarii]KAE8143545.1 hypothetical protein BDV38DRAFT_231619 [Aspergillus pseudotamarii]
MPREGPEKRRSVALPMVRFVSVAPTISTSCMSLSISYGASLAVGIYEGLNKSGFVYH